MYYVFYGRVRKVPLAGGGAGAAARPMLFSFLRVPPSSQVFEAALSIGRVMIAAPPDSQSRLPGAITVHLAHLRMSESGAAHSHCRWRLCVQPPGHVQPLRKVLQASEGAEQHGRCCL